MTVDDDRCTCINNIGYHLMTVFFIILVVGICMCGVVDVKWPYKFCTDGDPCWGMRTNREKTQCFRVTMMLFGVIMALAGAEFVADNKA